MDENDEKYAAAVQRLLENIQADDTASGGELRRAAWLLLALRGQPFTINDLQRVIDPTGYGHAGLLETLRSVRCTVHDLGWKAEAVLEDAHDYNIHVRFCPPGWASDIDGLPWWRPCSC